MVLPVPPSRLRSLVPGPPRPGAYVLYWMIGARRRRASFALQHAAAQAEALGLPLLVVEPLACTLPHASTRFHRFVVEGMRDNARAFAGSAASYLPWVEREPGQGREVFTTLSAGAALCVTDDAVGYVYPRILASLAELARCPVEAVDGVGLLPMAAAGRAWHRAHDFRRMLTRELPGQPPPLPDPLEGLELPRLSRLPRPPGTLDPEQSIEALLGGLPIDQSLTPSPLRGGASAARDCLEAFVGKDYSQGRHPDAEATSGLSPYLHFGHLGAWEAFDRVADGDFRDELVTWRELSHNGARYLPDHDRYEGLPAWARKSLEEHADDPRQLVSFERLDAARSPDPLWNALQRQLRDEGRMPGYLRMIWGKRVLEWAPSPREAFDWLLALNDRYALDGRDPNSVSGVAWCLGRYDRAWGPERPIFGKIRYMSSAASLKKLKLSRWLARWSTDEEAAPGYGASQTGLFG